eukprot:6609187-Prymnesium_polylepis.1
MMVPGETVTYCTPSAPPHSLTSGETTFVLRRSGSGQFAGATRGQIAPGTPRSKGQAPLLVRTRPSG